MLPVPFLRWIPAAFQGGDDPARDAFCTQVDSVVASARDGTLGIGRIRDPARAPSSVLVELGYMLEAGLSDRDPDATKRAKVAAAVRSHKSRSTWADSVKPLVDSMVGGDSTLESQLGTDSWIVCGSGLEPGIYLWSVVGGADPDAGYGIRLSGAGNVLGLGTDLGSMVEPAKGTILINVGSNSLTEAEVEELKAALADYALGYLLMYLGYVSGGAFVPYDNGLI